MKENKCYEYMKIIYICHLLNIVKYDNYSMLEYAFNILFCFKCLYCFVKKKQCMENNVLISEIQKLNM